MASIKCLVYSLFENKSHVKPIVHTNDEIWGSLFIITASSIENDGINKLNHPISKYYHGRDDAEIRLTEMHDSSMLVPHSLPCCSEACR